MNLPEDTLGALARIRESETRIYLGARYGFTPQTCISPEHARGFFGSKNGRNSPEAFCDVAFRFGNAVGRPQLARAFENHYTDLEGVSPEALQELNLLQPFAVGKVLVTGSYSTKLTSYFSGVTIAVDDSGVPNIRPRSGSRNTYLVLLHGQQSDPSGALLTRQEVDGFERRRPDLSALLKDMLREPAWVVLGFDQVADGTFFRICYEICVELGVGQRPLYVVDPRDSDLVASEWPRGPMRHVQMTPLDFLKALDAQNEAEEASPPASGKPAPGRPAPPDEPPVPTDGDEMSPPPGEALREIAEESDKSRRPPGPGSGPGAATPRSIEIEALDGRVFRVAVSGDLRVSALAGQFIRRHVHSEGGRRGERAVVDVEREGGWQRLNGNETLDDAGVQDGDRLRAYSDTVAGSGDPRRRESYLNDIQMQLEELAAHDDRISVHPNLPRASDRYEVVLHCGGWGPPETIAQKPYRTDEQKVLIVYPAEAPDVPPVVWWQSPIFHPNVSPKNGFVCLGALQKSFTPLFGPRELVYMLIEVSEYRNYELEGVLNREAAIWAQLRPELITSYGGWAYQPTMGEGHDENEPVLEFEAHGTGVGLRRSRKL